MKNTILVVGGAQTRALIVSMLHQLKYLATEEAQHGQQALLKIKQCATAGDPVQVIISEFNMPVLNGAGIINQLKVQQYDIPVIFLSGSTSESREQSSTPPVMLDFSPHLLQQYSDGSVRYTELDAMLQKILGLVEA
ncbi:MAG: response regulator [Patescibacteria group bacterium]